MENHEEENVVGDEELKKTQDTIENTEDAEPVLDESEIKNHDGESNKEEKKIKLKKKHSKEKELEDRCKELEIKNHELHDKYVRIYSEFDNYRKRTIKEKLDLIRNASEEVIGFIIPIIDDFERAIRLMENTGDIEAVKEGEKLIYTKLKSILEQKGLQEMKCLGEPFNPDLQEALSQMPAASDDLKGKIIDVIEKGYSLNDKVIRHAKVVVAN
jgi:molecular chaperone GrpE